jgi:hypothetical protein
MYEDLKQKIIEMVDNNRYDEAKKITGENKELKDFLRIQIMMKNTLPDFRMDIIPDRIENRILNNIYDKIDNEKTFNLFEFIVGTFSFPKLNYSSAISILLILLIVGFSYIKPNNEKLSYYSYKVKSNVQYLIDKVSGAKDILVYMFDKNIEKVYDNLINKEKKNKEERKWQIKTEKNRRGSLYYYHSFLG